MHFEFIGFRFHCHSRDLEEFHGIGLNNRENMWTSERGYASEVFKNNEDKYPRPGVGNIKLELY